MSRRLTATGGSRSVRSANRRIRGSVTLGLSSLLMISLSVMGVAVPLAQGVEPDQSETEVAAQLKAAVEGTAPAVDDAENGIAEDADSTEKAPSDTQADETPGADAQPSATTLAEPSPDAGTTETVEPSTDLTDQNPAQPSPAEKPTPAVESTPPVVEADVVPDDAAVPEEAGASDDTDTPQQSAIAEADALDGPQTIAPMAVPPAEGNDAVITVKVGGDRTGLTTVSELAGVTLGFYENETGGLPLYQCTSDADGDCSITVPNTQVGGANRDAQFFVRQISAPTGWYENTELRTGSSSAARSEATPYSFPTSDELRSGNIYTSTADFMFDTTLNVRKASTGIWQNSRINPVFPQACGIDVGLVIDISGSTAAANTSLKEAADTLAQSLVGTPSRMALFSFASDSPASGAGRNFPELTSVSTQEQADAFKARYAGWDSDGATNWDQGLAAPGAAADIYDVVVFMTDGNPTVYGNPRVGSRGFGSIIEAETGIFSANRLKAQGSRVIAFGVGDAVTNDANSRLNLRAVSGRTEFDGTNYETADFFRTEDYAQAGAQLQQLALGSCEGSVTVIKEVIPADGTVDDAAPAAGWTFTAEGSANVTVASPNTLVTPEETGAVNFPLTFAGGTASGPVTVTETPQTGFSLEQVDGNNATCTRLDTDAPVASTNTDLGFSVDANRDYPVGCIVYNRALPQPELTLEKVVDNGATGATFGPADWTLAADGPTPISGAGNSAAVTDQSVGVGVYTLSESGGPDGYTAGEWSCTDGTLDGNALTLDFGDDATCTIVNTATPPTLTLVKTVTNNDGGTAVPTDWTLTASGPTTGISGPVGADAVTDRAVAVGSYDLSESGGQSGYTASVWSCTGGVQDGSTVTIGLGEDVTCSINNDDVPASLTLIKDVVNDDGGVATPQDWDLSAVAPDGSTNLTDVVSGTPEATDVRVLPGEYTLTEAGGPSNYELIGLVCTNDGEPNSGVNLVNNVITVAAGDEIVCTFTNDDLLPELQLFKSIAGAEQSFAENWILSASGAGVDLSGAGGTPSLAEVPANTAITLAEERADDFPGSGEFTDGEIWTCVDQAANNATVEVSDTDQISLVSGQQVACTIVNTFEGLPPTIEKTAATPVNNADGSWTITYTVTVTNPSEVAPAAFEVDDELLFGGGITVTSASVSGIGARPEWNGITDTVVSTVQTVNPGAAPVVYTVTVNAEIEDGAFTSDEAVLECAANPADRISGGFLNTTDLRIGDNIVGTDEACVTPAAPTFSKVAGTPLQLADGSWNVVYTLTATNSSSLPLFYDLSDTLDFDSDLIINTAGAAGPDGSIDDWDGDGSTTLAEDVQLAAADGDTPTEDVYTITVNVSVPVTATTADVTCAVTGDQSGTGTFNSATLTSTGQSLEDTDCVDIPLSLLEITKTVTAISQNPDGTWLVTYNVDVENDGDTATQYSLDDTLDFGGGLTPDAAAWSRTAPVTPALSGTWADPAATPSTTIVTDELIGGNTTHSYTVSVTASVAGGQQLPEGALCTGEDNIDGGGFLNTATVTFPGGSADAADCASPTVPSVRKDFTTSVQNDDSSWSVSYDITVDNTGGVESYYSITDTPGFPDGVVVEGWSVTATGTPDPEVDPWSGTEGTIVEDRLIAADATHVYSVLFTLDIPGGLPEAERECATGPGNGLFNSTTLTSGEQTRDDDACAPVEEVGVPTVTKTVSGISQNLDGTWTVSYSLTVTANEEFNTRYDLTDTLRFGDGTTVNSAAWEWTNAPADAAAGDASGTWADGEDTTTLATARVLPSGTSSHVYDITVVASVPQDDVGTNIADCVLVDDETGTGFLNSATMTSAGIDSTVEACESPTEPNITKDNATADQQDDASWNVSYTLTVDNSEGFSTFYDLVDDPGFPTGVTINNWSVVAGLNTPEVNPAPWPNATIVVGQAIAANSVHTYTVTFNVDVDVTISSTVLECVADGGEAGNGFFNEARLTVNGSEQTDEDCVDIPVPGEPVVIKTLGSVDQNVDGSWTVTYGLTVTGDVLRVTEYTLVDTLLFGDGASVQSATWSWDDAPDGETAEGAWVDPVDENTSASIATDRVLPPAATDTYTVTVVVDVAEGVVGTTSMTCDAATEEEPNTGFLNRAEVLVDGSVVDSAEACGDPATVEFSKTADSLSANGDGTFDAVYTLTVTSDATDGQSVVYSISDIPEIPEGVELVERSVVSDQATDDDAVVDEAWNTGDTDVIAAGQSIEQDEADVYTVTLRIRVTEPLTSQQRECEAVDGGESGGLLNTGTVVTGNDSLPADACVDLPDPSFTVAKVADGAVETAEGTWEVTYTVTVDNESEIPGTYSLSDTLRYGEGITATAATWELSGSDPVVEGVWDLTTGNAAVLATDRGLAAGGTDVYLVTVTADVEPTVVGTTAGVCESDTDEGNRAFTNEATVSWDDETATAEDCAEPVVNFGSLSAVKKVVGETAGFTAGDEAVFEFIWECATPAGETVEGTAAVADGETKLLGDQIPVGSVCSVSETAPEGNLESASYTWGAPSYSADSVTLTIAEPDSSVTVTNTVERVPDDGPPPPQKPGKPDPVPPAPEKPSRPGLLSNTGAGAWGGIIAASVLLIGAGTTLAILGRRRRRMT